MVRTRYAKGSIKGCGTAIAHQPSEKIPRGRPRKRWFDGVSQDLRTLDVEDRKNVIQDRERWKTLTVVVKTLRESS